MIEIPITNIQSSTDSDFIKIWFLGFWLLFGYWCLGFGASLSLPFLKSVEDLFDLSSPSELGWKKFDLPLAIHLPTQSGVFKEILRLRFKLNKKAQFMDAAFRFDGIQKNGME